MDQGQLRLNEAYRRPLEIDLAGWSRKKGFEFILLGSIASSKYSKVLTEFLDDHVFVPTQFRGLGDMSRGSLMLRAVAEGRELDYERLLMQR